MLTACQGVPQPQTGEASGTPIVLGRGYEIASAALGEMRRLNVYLPLGYASGDKRYPVLYLPHGGDEDEAIAGLLHDAVEDQGGQKTLAEIRHRFGDRVADLAHVVGHER